MFIQANETSALTKAASVGSGIKSNNPYTVQGNPGPDSPSAFLQLIQCIYTRARLSFKLACWCVSGSMEDYSPV